MMNIAICDDEKTFLEEEKQLILKYFKEQKRLLIKVAYYNLEMGEDITMEQLLDSYNAFLDGD